MPVGYIHKASELELASILMLKNVNKFQDVDACLFSTTPTTQVGMHYYKSSRYQDDNSE